jgi:hypothetical protein
VEGFDWDVLLGATQTHWNRSIIWNSSTIGRLLAESTLSPRFVIYPKEEGFVCCRLGPPETFGGLPTAGWTTTIYGFGQCSASILTREAVQSMATHMELFLSKH